MIVFYFLFTFFLAVFSNKFYLIDFEKNLERPDVRGGSLRDIGEGKRNFEMQSIRKREYGNNYADEQSDLFEKLNALKQSLIRTQISKVKTKKKIPEEEEIDDDEYSAE